MAGSPDLASDIKNLGVRFVSKANNHSVDWGAAGLLEELRLLDAASLPYAGAGENRAAARAAGFVDTPKGRIGVVSAASSFSVGAIPLDEDADIPARPGISVLRTTSVQIVNAPGGSATSVILVVEDTFDANVARGEVPRGLRSPKAGSTARSTTSRSGSRAGGSPASATCVAVLRPR